MTQPLHRLPKIAIGLLLFLAIGAICGGLALILGPRGEILPLPLSLLLGSPFTSYLVPGTILFVVLGLGPLGVAILAWRKSPTAPALTLFVGSTLIVWIVAEIIIVGYSNEPPLQAAYFGLGVVIAMVGVAWLRETGSHRHRHRRHALV